MKLYTYFRSSTSYRVRIALNLKGLNYESVFVNLKKEEQMLSTFQKVNPSGGVPVLELEGKTYTQSLAIIELLDAKYTDTSFSVDDLETNIRMKELAYAVSTDIHAVNNLRVLNYLSNELNVEPPQKNEWYKHWINQTFAVLEAKLRIIQSVKDLPFGKPTLFEIVLIPQVYNALRFDVDMSKYQKIMQTYQTCIAIPAFADAAPESQPDAPKTA